VLKEDLRFNPMLLDMDLSCFEELCAISRTLRALSREFDRLRLGTDVGEVRSARLVAATRARGDAVGGSLKV
jgi:hypothetical protein